MGNCRSRRPLIRSNFTAKLILLNGKLLEFTHPIKVSLLMEQNTKCFICSAEGMEFGRPAAEVGGEEFLRPGEVYFELRVGWRSQPMQGEDMAALAVKASLALFGRRYVDEAAINCGCFASGSKVEPVVRFWSEEAVPSPAAVGGGDGCKGRRKFVAELSAITEE